MAFEGCRSLHSKKTVGSGLVGTPNFIAGCCLEKLLWLDVAFEKVYPNNTFAKGRMDMKRVRVHNLVRTRRKMWGRSGGVALSF